jgi:hypothetical protein
MRTEKTWTCKVACSDGRCPDGCCGCVSVSVTSPKTGRVVRLDLNAIPTEARSRIVEAVIALPGHRTLECRKNLSGTVSVNLSKSDLEAILRNEGACYT